MLAIHASLDSQLIAPPSAGEARNAAANPAGVEATNLGLTAHLAGLFFGVLLAC